VGVQTVENGDSDSIFVIAALGVMFAVLALAKEPPTVNYAAGHHPGQPVDVTMQTVGAYGSAPNPTWVSYMTRTPQGQWVHTTLWQVPAHTRNQRHHLQLRHRGSVPSNRRSAW